MRFEVRYMAVFRAGADPAAIIRGALQQAYMDELGESRGDGLISSVLAIDLTHIRADGQTIVRFQVADDREETLVEKLVVAFGRSLNADPTVDHVLKFHDTAQYARNERYAKEIYRLEMQLREVISFIFIDSIGENYFNLLKDNKVDVVGGADKKPSEPDFRNNQENEFFFILFNSYVNLNERKLPTNSLDLLKVINQAADFSALQESLSAQIIRDHAYVDFMARIKTLVSTVEKIRNCVAHNRSISTTTLGDYQRAVGPLRGAIDAFLAALPGRNGLLAAPPAAPPP